MNADRLFADYERIADAPEAIPRLRRFILDLAVRGKLVPQDPHDEPAAKLLERISAEKISLSKAGNPKVAGIAAVTRGADGYFEVPSSWAWACLGDVAQYGSSAKVNSNKDISEDTWVLDLEDIEKETSRLIERVLSSVRGFGSTKTVFRRGDVLFGKLRPYLNKVLVADQDGVCTSEIVPIRGYCGLVPEYVRLVLKSPLTMARVDRLMYGMKMPRLGTDDAVAIGFPLPPIEEQHRIVAKVDELMVLCDRLAAARAQREATRDRLAAASLARLNAPEPDSLQDDARFALNALPALTMRPDQIGQFRQTILNLALRGKLLPQDECAPTKEVELESLVKIVRGSSPRPKGDPRYYGGPIPRLLIADITRDGKYVTPQLDNLTVEGARLSRPMPKGSLVIAISGSYGVPAFLAVDACIHDGFIGFREVSPSIDLEYLYLVMQFRRPYFDDVVKDSGLKNLTTEHLKRLMVPLYPIVAQRRIVAKVDELMALCSRLEASLAHRDDTRLRLLEALLAEALAPQEAA